jgi:gamma-glutamyltranspeptidase/glutathione hydrolase
VVLLETLNILAGYDLDKLDAVTRDHLLIEAMRRAYRDRAAWLGDPDMVDMPVDRLIAKDYAAKVSAQLNLDHATPSASLPPLAAPASEYPNTTHFSVLDGEGNRVAATLSINLPFGSGFVPPGTGVLLNDEMDDFSAKPLTPNAYGLVGVDANAIAPGKRPLSSMTPTFLEAGPRVGILGTPGGSRIISMVLLGVLEFAAGEPPAAWVSTPRFHHQYLPDVVQYEPGAFTAEEQQKLRSMGHTLEESSRRYGNMQAVLWDSEANRTDTASDPRGEGSAMVDAIEPQPAGTQDLEQAGAPSPATDEARTGTEDMPPVPGADPGPTAAPASGPAKADPQQDGPGTTGASEASEADTAKGPVLPRPSGSSGNLHP